MKETTLETYGIQKSFYGKASVITMESGYKLRSYNTIVAEVVNGEFKRIWCGWSATTAKHINAFRAMCGMPSIRKAEWDAMEIA